MARMANKEECPLKIDSTGFLEWLTKVFQRVNSGLLELLDNAVDAAGQVAAVVGAA